MRKILLFSLLLISMGVLAVDDFAGNCLEFDGSNDYVQVGTSGSIGLSGECTVEAWINVPSSVPDGTRVGIILGNNNYSPHFNFEVITLGRLRIYWNGGQIDMSSTGIDVRDDAWHHVAMVRDQSAYSMKMYIDGNLNNSSSAGTNLDIQWPLRFGDDFRNGTSPAVPFNGMIDEVRVWNTARTQTEIRATMNSAPEGSETGLVSYWQFNESSGTTASDAIGSNDGTLSNMDDNDWVVSTIPICSFAGNGTSGNPFEISNLSELQELSENSSLWSYHFIQTADINATDTQNWNSGAGFSPIGDNEIYFSGTFDGDEHEIDNLFIYEPFVQFKGLFGKIDNATISNLGVTNVDITGYHLTGGLVGRANNNSSIANCYTTGNVYGNDAPGDGSAFCGGLVGYNHSTTISNCYSTVEVDAEHDVGGLIGRTYSGAVISNCYSTGDVIATINYVGGFVGLHDNSSTISNCYSTGSAGGSSYVGGFAGRTQNGSTVNNSFWDTQTSGHSSSSGGTGKTTAEMQTQNTFTDDGWDFVIETANGTDDNWKIFAGEYPKLIWQESIPVVITGEATTILWNTATSGGEAFSTDEYPVTAKGVCWSTSPNPEATDYHTDEGTGNGVFTSSITGLAEGGTYYYRAYATNAPGTSYGEEYSFTTPTIDVEEFAGYCLDFDGSNDYVSLGNSHDLKPTEALTVEVWAYSYDWTTANGVLVGNTQAGGYDIALSTGQIRTEIFVNGVYLITSYNATSLPTGWHHCTLTFDGRYSRLYIDGILEVTGDAGANYPVIYHELNHTLIGAEASSGSASGGNHFNGKLDEVRIWNTARTQAEIQDNIDNAHTGYEPDLVGYWQFNDREGNTLADGVNFNDGTLIDMETSGLYSDWFVSDVPFNEPIDTPVYDDVAGNCLEFDGSLDDIFINTSDIPAGRAATFSAWVKTTASGDNCILSYERASYNTNMFVIDSPGNLRVGHYNQWWVTGVAINDGNWHHIIVSAKNNTSTTNLILFKDGVKVAESSVSVNDHIFPQGGILVLGQEQDITGGYFSPSQAFEGQMDEVAIYDAFWDEINLNPNFHGTLKGTEDNLIAYWQFNEPESDRALNKVDGMYSAVYGAERVNSTVAIDDEVYIYEDTTWSTDNTFSDNVYISDGVTLTVTEGTTHSFAHNAGIYCYGSINAVGSPENRITFTKNNTSNNWDGLNFKYTEDESNFEHCIIEYGSKTDGGNLRLFSYNKVLLENSYIRYGFASVGAGVRCIDSNLEMKNCVVSNNTASTYGGAFNIAGSGCLVNLYNLTITQNVGNVSVSAIRSGSGAITNVRNSIIYNNNNGINNFASSGGTLNIYDSIVDGDLGQLDDYSNIYDVDPVIIEDPPGEFISHSHYSMDYGVDYTGRPNYDILGNPRIYDPPSDFDGLIDIGAYELQGIPGPDIEASKGDSDHQDEIHVTWDYEHYIDIANKFRVFRDGVQVDSLLSEDFEGEHTFEYIDYVSSTIVRGAIYSYYVEVITDHENATSAEDSGYLLSSGIITGTVLTTNNNPVQDVAVSITPDEPVPNYCVELSGTNESVITLPKPDIDFSEDFTIEFWLKTASSTLNTPILQIPPHEFGISPSGHAAHSDGLNYLLQPDTLAAINDDQWHHIAIVNDFENTGALLYVDTVLVAIDSLFTFVGSSALEITTAQGFTGSLSQLRVWSTVRDSIQIESSMNVSLPGSEVGLAGYWTMNEGTGSVLFDTSTSHNFGELSNCTWAADGPEVMLGATTNSFGVYRIEQIPFANGAGTIFTVVPYKRNHFFLPEQLDVPLNSTQSAANNVDFTDNSLVPIYGRIIYQDDENECPVEGVRILKNGEGVIPPCFTDEDGYYVFEVENGESIRISAEYPDHTFNIEYYYAPPGVTMPLNNIDFVDETEVDIRVEVVGGDDHFPIGDFEVTLHSVNLCYFKEIENGDWADGGITLRNIPPLDYNVTVTADSENDPFALFGNYIFDTRLAELTTIDSLMDTLRFVWKAPLEIEVSWPETLELHQFADNYNWDESLYEFYVLTQNDWYEIEIQAFEDYSWGGQDQISYLNNCGLTIVDEVGTQGEIETNFQDTIYVHRFAPYIPNFLTGTGRQYQNLMSVTVHDVELNRYAEQLDFVLIEGVKPMEYTFTSTTPEIPTLILHDPPGDASYSSFLEHHSFTSVSTYSTSSGTVESDFHTAYLALDSTVGLGSGFFTSEYTLDGTDDLEWGMVETSSLLNSNTIMTTTTTTEGFSTSSDDQIIGDGSDLFFGGARNLIWGHIKMVSWDSDIQEIILKDSVMITEGDYKTEFIYTENQIKNTVIPDLIELEETESVLQWLAILDRNEYNKANADSIPGLSNLSFNAGASYSYEVETTAFQDTSWTFVTEFDDSFGIAIGAQFNGAGYVYNTKKSTITFSDSTFSEIIDTTKTYSFTLADNDETSDLNEYADYFSVNVKKDPIYLTPVFELVSGISSCPWEPNTQPREGVDLTANTYSANNLQEGESAAFILTLGNTSQSEEDRRYYLTVKHGTNPNGATIKINGVPLEDQMAFDVPADGTAQAVMTVEQGPLAYEYENLTLEFYSECDRGSEGIYDNPPEDQEPQIYHHFSMEKSFDVTWEPPYSRIAIGSPEDDWIVNQANDDNLNVLLRDYDLTKPDFKSIKLQYKIPSSDIWFPAFEIVRDTLEANYPVYANIPWDVSGIPDGIYEIRAATTDSIQADYYTGSLQGVIDRVSPELLSPPEPADDILEPGDVISISFAEEIDATTLDEADISLINYGGLDIGIEVTAFENTVFITPNISNFWFENDILIASVSGIKDLYGNEMEEAETWEFYVNSNPVNWNVTQIDVIKSLGEEMTLTANLINEGGQHYSYIFTDDADSQYHPDLQYHAPDWLTITPTSGQLIPLDTQEISFEISDQIGFGHYETTIYAHTSMGNEAIQIEVDVLSDPPNWTITEFNNFQSNMSVIGELDFEGDISVDTNDIIGAFMQEESGDWVCRGVANIESVPYIPSHPYQVFLTIYSDESDPVRTEDEIVFRVWDNSENKEYYQIDHSVFGGTLMYLANEVYGTPMTPISLATVTDMVQDIPLTNGWTWFSSNIDHVPNTINDVLSSLSPADDDFIKYQDAYAQYFADEWIGTLGIIRNSSMYKINLAEAQILEIIGELKDPELYSISYNTGWNWISYIPHISMSVNQAMSERTNTTGDFIKNQSGYAFYVDAFTGWIGSLRFMNPGEGFMLYSSATGSFNYPGYQIRYDDDYPEYEPIVLRDAPVWSVNPQSYEYTASVTAEIQINGNPTASGNYMLGAFAGEECRGSVTPINVGGTWMYFLTVFSNTQNEEIEFRIYDEDADEILNPSNSFTFNNDLVMGSPSNPYSVNILGTLSTPQNVTIQIAAGEVQISWDLVTSADSYKVFASDDPYGTFIDISNSGTFDNNRWTAAATEERRFYYVKASTEPTGRSAGKQGFSDKNRIERRQ